MRNFKLSVENAADIIENQATGAVVYDDDVLEFCHWRIMNPDDDFPMETEENGNGKKKKKNGKQSGL